MNVFHHPHNVYVIFLFLLASFITLPHQISAQNVPRGSVSVPGGGEVNTLTGNLMVPRTDLKFPVRGKFEVLDLTFFYNSAKQGVNFGYGNGWTHNYNQNYSRDSVDNITIMREDGREDQFILSNGLFLAPTGIFDTLTEYETGKFRLSTKHQIEFYFDDSTHQRLTSIVEPNGNSLTMNYTGNLLMSITGPGGRSVDFSYADSLLSTITNPNAMTPQIISYEYDGQRNMTKVTDDVGNETTYQYTEDALMESAEGKNDYCVSFGYSNGCSIGSVNSPLNNLSFQYDTAMTKTLVFKDVGTVQQISTFAYDPDGRLTMKSGSCCGFNQCFTYDEDNNIETFGNANGEETGYSYDAQGNVTGITDALGNSINYTYEPVFNQIATMTDKNGNLYTYSYDPNGNLTSLTYPNGDTDNYTYDSFGNRTSFTDPEGHTTTFTYNTAGDILTETDPLGNTVTFTYDGIGNMLSVNYPNNATTSYAYDDLNRLISITDPGNKIITLAYDNENNLSSATNVNGETVTFIYDGLNRLISETTQLGYVTSYTYDEMGNQTSMTDPRGNTSIFIYDELNHLEKQIDPQGNTMSFTYDAAGNQVSQTDARGNTTSKVYDELNRLISITDPFGNSMTMTYDPMGNMTSETDFSGNMTTFTYDSRNRMVSQTDPLGNTRTQTYDGNHNKLTETDENGNTFTYTYEERQLLSSITDPLGNISSKTYDAIGNLLTEMDFNGNVLTFTYTIHDEIATQTNPMGETTSYAYDDIGNLTAITKPNGNVISMTYDAMNRKTSMVDSYGPILSWVYDETNNVLTQTDGSGKTLTFTYDELSRRSTMTDPDGYITRMRYDRSFNLVRTIRPDGTREKYTYDALNRLASKTDPNGNTISYGYDASGNLLSQLNPIGVSMTYEYDALNRMTRRIYQNGSFLERSYDPAGNINSVTQEDGSLISYTYDGMDRMLTEDVPGSNDITMVYDDNGRVVSASNMDATVSYTYDSANRKLTETLNGKTTSFSYDIPGNTKTITYPSGKVITYHMDISGYIDEVKEGSTVIADYSYNGAHMRDLITYANGTTNEYEYNSRSMISRIEHKAGGSTLFGGYEYNYNPVGSRTHRVDLVNPNHSEQYAYDAAQRLTSFKRGTSFGINNVPNPDKQIVFAMNSVGNRISKSEDGFIEPYSANDLNQYTDIGGSSILYDGKGNLLDDGTFDYAYNDQNQLTLVDGGTIAEYKYDPFGRRIQKITPLETINYYYDYNRLIEERNTSDVTIAEYIYGQSLDEVVRMDRSGSSYYYHYDALGSVMSLTDGAGSVVEKYLYDPYGMVTVFDAGGTALSGTFVGNPFRFTGRLYDEETGLYNYRNRYYDPAKGRFLQRDLVDEIHFTNLYSYVESNPVNETDPLGLTTVTWRPIPTVTQIGTVIKRFRKGRKEKGERVSTFMVINGCCYKCTYTTVYWVVKDWALVYEKLRVPTDEYLHAVLYFHNLLNKMNKLYNEYLSEWKKSEAIADGMLGIGKAAGTGASAGLATGSSALATSGKIPGWLGKLGGRILGPVSIAISGVTGVTALSHLNKAKAALEKFNNLIPDLEAINEKLNEIERSGNAWRWRRGKRVDYDWDLISKELLPDRFNEVKEMVPMSNCE